MMTLGQSNLGNGGTTQERFSGPYRGGRRDGGPADDGPAKGDAPRNGMSAVDRAPKLPPLDLDGLSDPVFPPPGWDEPAGQRMADHPLLRGLLLELPPKGTLPDPGWLDRWFEATRSVIELLYLQDAGRPR
ncbi:hypothetical protein [Polymorphospora rubra]|nr:hypothetical protein [Polymorphospora rubra]